MRLFHSIRGVRHAACSALALLALSVPGASAQETRAEVIAQEKARKAANLKPYVPSTAERIVTKVTQGFITPPSGLFPAFGSVYSGGGFAVGPGVRYYVGDRSTVHARGMYSVRGYKLVDGGVTVPELAGGRLALRANAGWRDATQIGFFGVGMNASPDIRANYRMKQTFASGQADLRPAGPLFLGAAVGFEDYDLLRGKGSRPSIEDVYTPATAPGLGAKPTYTVFSVSGGIDSRPAPGYARQGGLYGLAYHSWRDRDDTFSFDRVDAEVVQHLPVLRENWVLSLHGRVESTIGDTDIVPYFLLPSLGSGSTLRAYSTGRFRDRHALLLQAEWRWIPNRAALDVALFVDMGKVANRRADLDLDGLKTDVGIGFRIHAPRVTPLRIDLARGREGFNLVFSGGAAF
jgi:hypothetical protein